MDIDTNFQLYQWITSNAPTARAILAGSATPSLSLKEIIFLSSDPQTTSRAFSFDHQLLGLASAQGAEPLRKALANTYDHAKSCATKDNIIIANGTTGANHIVYRSLLKPGDHVVVQYPTYGPLIEEPMHIGCDVSFWRLRLEQNWDLDIEELKRLIRPGVTKMLILNNPSNPTGTHLPTKIQREIVEVAKQHGIIVACDEIFRPLFHGTDEGEGEEIPTSLVEHADSVDYDDIIVTSSLSKCYGLSGVRIGWIVTRSSTLHAKFMHYRLFSVQSVSVIDELIGAEVLSPRCRQNILQKHLTLARTNLDLIQAFVDKHCKQCEWIRPTAGACAFIKLKDLATGQPMEDVEFGRRLVAEKGVLISPASLCFSLDESTGKGSEAWRKEFEGRFRFHFTTKTEVVQQGLRLLGEFLDEEKVRSGVKKL